MRVSSITYTADFDVRCPDKLAPKALRVKVCNQWDEIEKLQPAWDSILAENPRLTMFSTREWLASWWSAYGMGVPLESFTFHSENQAVGIAPFFRDFVSFLGIRKLAQLCLVGAGSGDSDNLDLVIRPGFEEAAATAFLANLEGRNDWDLCWLETLPAASTIGNLLPAKLTALGWPYQVSRVPNWSVSLPQTWNAYLEGLSPEFRPLLTRYPKRLESRYACRLSRCQTEADLERYLPVLFDLHQRRWVEAGQPGAFASAERRQFYRALASALLSRGWLDFWILELGDLPVAVQFCCRHEGTVYLLQEGFDPEYTKEKVGYALRAKVLQHYIQTGVQRYDFMGGSDPYKQKFGAEQGSYLTIRFAKPRSLGTLFLHVEESKQRSRSWLRTHLPAWLVSQVRALRMRRHRRQSTGAGQSLNEKRL